MGDYWIKINKLNNVYSQITSNHPSIVHNLYNFLTVYVEGYRFMPKYKAGIWDGKVSFMTKAGVFQSGLLKYVYDFIKQDGLKIEIDPSLLERLTDVENDLVQVTNEWMADGFVPRNYQFDGAIKALHYKRGILEHATSSGKSLTMAIMIMYALRKNLADKVLILVPSIGLVKQLASDFEEYGVPPEFIGQFYGFQKDTENPIIISTWQSMCKQKELTESFTMIVVDEVHGVRGNVVRSVADNAINASIRIGCTGTMPETKDSIYAIEGALGPVLHKITAKQLIDLKHASDISIRIPFINYSKKVTKELKGITFDMEREWLENYSPRNNVIKVITKKHTDKTHNVLILVDHIAHGETIVNKIKEIEDVEVFFVSGETPADERERIRKYTNDHEKVVIVATYQVFSTGISIRRLHSVIFASAGKSKIRVLQSIGRGLRLHNEKKKFILYDIGDNLTYSEKHLKARVNIYTKAEFDVDAFEINLDKEEEEKDSNAIV